MRRLAFSRSRSSRAARRIRVRPRRRPGTAMARRRKPAPPDAAARTAAGMSGEATARAACQRLRSACTVIPRARASASRHRGAADACSRANSRRGVEPPARVGMHGAKAPGDPGRWLPGAEPGTHEACRAGRQGLLLREVHLRDVHVHGRDLGAAPRAKLATVIGALGGGGGWRTSLKKLARHAAGAGLEQFGGIVQLTRPRALVFVDPRWRGA